ncbi:multifunctional transcriptional regulator/nicotinamide-nucleotide adenylyltransferase/ribosylnicotinamide kinase NadR [Orbaceae bacterium ESL0721]|nr:multifunctional transcriptional regulator/nicotinamide-nucleotide adenylyltransferase/ribosylnicotinamide kinase NadR [Orbaceae bacterium ESL0721]
MAHQIGLIFGKFYPLHCGHLYLIEKAVSQVDELHIMLGCEAERDNRLFIKSHLPKQPEVSDRLLWLQKTFNHRPNIHIHLLDESGITAYPNGWQDWSDRVKAILHEQDVKPTVIFTSEPQDVDNHAHYFNCQVKIIDADRDFIPISATEIRQNPYKSWSYIAKAAQPFFVRTVAIIGKERLRELPIQLANIYNTSYVKNDFFNDIEQGILYQRDHRYLSENDFIKHALSYADCITQAAKSANKLLFTTIDFEMLDNYYQHIFKHKSVVLAALSKNLPADLTINEALLDSESSRLDLFNLVTKQVDQLLI